MVCGILVVLFSSVAYAQIGVPHQFFGSVTANGVAAPDGLSVVAKIDNLEVAGTATLNGNYGLLPGEIFYIEDPNGNRYGDTIEFYVQGIKAAEYIFSNGDSTLLDLSVTGNLGICGDNTCASGESCSSCPQDCGECPPSNGGSPPSSGGYTPPSGGETPCAEDWTCSDWSICSQKGRQLRSCTDGNDCGTEKEKPAEEKTCTYTPAEAPVICAEGIKVCSDDKLMECSGGRQWNVIRTCEYGCDSDKLECKSAAGEGPAGDGITGFLIGDMALYGIIILIIAILGAVAYWKLRKPRKAI
jgi:hypothetical protein